MVPLRLPTALLGLTLVFILTIALCSTGRPLPAPPRTSKGPDHAALQACHQERLKASLDALERYDPLITYWETKGNHPMVLKLTEGALKDSTAALKTPCR